MPPERRIARYLAEARRRMLAIRFARALSLSCGIGAAYVLARSRFGMTRAEILSAAVIALAAAAAAAWRWRRNAAAALEARAPSFRNALVTAEELIRDPARAKPYIRDLVFADTAARIERVDLGATLPARRAGLLAVAALIVFSASVAFAVTRPETAGDARRGGGATTDGPATIEDVEAIVLPPIHTRLAQRRLRNPDRIDVVEGSRIALRVRSAGGHVLLDSGGEPIPLRYDPSGTFAGEVVADGQPFIGLTAANIAPGERRLIVLSIAPDRAPDVRIAEPGRDLFLARPNQEIPVRVTAQDDFGMTSLTLAYTKVSGSGETFEFVEGTLPLAVTRASERELAGRAVIQPASLGLSSGDLLVYRAIARDSHPSRGPTESDVFVIEIVSESEAMAEGFSIDDQRDTYAISQQMVILKTERLIAARRSMTPQAVAEGAALISAEQRRVRAEFIFMMGGEVEDEEVEAEHAHEIEEGREQNQGRRDLLAAVRSMSDAAALLLRPDLEQALATERRALASLQRALTRSRYILRVLSRRERIDTSRRLSGDRSGTVAWRRDPPATADDSSVRPLRDALRQLSLLARKDAYSDQDAAAMTAVAEDLLRFAAGDNSLQPAIQHLTRAARTDRRDAAGIARLIDQAALAVDAALQARATASSPAMGWRSPLGLRAPDRIRSALADRLRAAPGGGGR